MTKTLSDYQAKQARVKAVWKTVNRSGLDVYQAFDHYVNALTASQKLFGSGSAEFKEARLNLEAFVHPWLERAS